LVHNVADLVNFFFQLSDVGLLVIFQGTAIWVEVSELVGDNFGSTIILRPLHLIVHLFQAARIHEV